AGAGQADHQAISDELVLADAFHVDNVLDARRRGLGAGKRRQEQSSAERGGDNGAEQAVWHLLPRLMPHHPVTRPSPPAMPKSCQVRFSGRKALYFKAFYLKPWMLNAAGEQFLPGALTPC